ncbi:hypothetical protein [Faecalibaculum rodentium]|uniref:hypothetical protein n=2 Tax=Faecalibaculum rodentium TaxID=1702221 RepID=UPI00258BAB61|nr:hypothetical protein [Faecalibaculum rodentium]
MAGMDELVSVPLQAVFLVVFRWCGGLPMMDGRGIGWMAADCVGPWQSLKRGWRAALGLYDESAAGWSR